MDYEQLDLILQRKEASQLDLFLHKKKFSMGAMSFFLTKVRESTRHTKEYQTSEATSAEALAGAAAGGGRTWRCR